MDVKLEQGCPEQYAVIETEDRKKPGSGTDFMNAMRGPNYGLWNVSPGAICTQEEEIEAQTQRSAKMNQSVIQASQISRIESTTHTQTQHPPDKDLNLTLTTSLPPPRSLLRPPHRLERISYRIPIRQQRNMRRNIRRR